MNMSSSIDPTYEYITLLEKLYTKHDIPNVKKHATDLITSVYSAQCNDYVMLQYNNYRIPVDAEMYSLVKYLIDNGLPLGGWNYRDSSDNCFFTVMTNRHHDEFHDIPHLVRTLYDIVGADIVKVHKGYDKERTEMGLMHVYLNNDEQSFVTVAFHYTVVDFLKSALNLPPAYGTLLPGCKRLVEHDMIDFNSLQDIRRTMYCNDVMPKDIYVTDKKISRKRKIEKSATLANVKRVDL